MMHESQNNEVKTIDRNVHASGQANKDGKRRHTVECDTHNIIWKPVAELSEEEFTCAWRKKETNKKFTYKNVLQS